MSQTGPSDRVVNDAVRPRPTALFGVARTHPIDWSDPAGCLVAAAMGNSLEKQFKKYEDKTELDLSKQEMRELPPAIGNLVRLVKLNVSENDLGSIPLEISARCRRGRRPLLACS